MKLEDQRIAFLEYLGWTDLNRDSKLGNYRALRGTSPDGKKDQIAPNPLVDLNIIHEAEKTLKWADQNDYLCYLWNPQKEDNWQLSHKSSLQKLESFLKTVNRWKE